MTSMHEGKDRRERTVSPDSTCNRRKFLSVFVLILLAALIVPPASGLVVLEYFHQQGCINCEKTDPIVDSVSEQYRGRVAVERVEVDDRAGVRLLISYGVTEIPVVVINRNKVLTYPDITPERLDTEIRRAEAGEYPVPARRSTIADGNNLPSILFSFSLGLMTGLSPCLLGSLIVVVAAGNAQATGTAGRYYPLVFGAGVITAYLVAAVGILGAGLAFSPGAGSRQAILIAAGLVAIAAGLLQAGWISLPARMKQRSSALANRFRTLTGSFLLGLVFSILFAPCALAPFLILIETILLENSIAPVFMLLAFSAGILVPFLGISLFREAVPEEKLLRYAGIVQKIGGLLLAGFGVWLLISAL